MYSSIIGTLLLATLLAPSADAAEVQLKSRYNGGTYEGATYSFMYMSQDEKVTYNNWEILFEAREDFPSYFDVETVVDDFSSIFDLGEMSCKDIKSEYPELRQSDPLIWLSYSEASQLMSGERKSTALVKTNHCYLAYNTDSRGMIVTLFHVKEQVPHKSVVIDEIEVLSRVIDPRFEILK